MENVTPLILYMSHHTDPLHIQTKSRETLVVKCFSIICFLSFVFCTLSLSTCQNILFLLRLISIQFYSAPNLSIHNVIRLYTYFINDFNNLVKVYNHWQDTDRHFCLSSPVPLECNKNI